MCADTWPPTQSLSEPSHPLVCTPLEEGQAPCAAAVLPPRGPETTLGSQAGTRARLLSLLGAVSPAEGCRASLERRERWQRWGEMAGPQD